jgi:hypothetical protein
MPKIFESITKKIKIMGLSMAAIQPYEAINVNFLIVLEVPPSQPLPQFSGNLIISKAEFKKLNATIGDELTITIASTEPKNDAT